MEYKTSQKMKIRKWARFALEIHWLKPLRQE